MKTTKLRLKPGDQVKIDGAKLKILECRFGSVLVEIDHPEYFVIQKLPSEPVQNSARRGLAGGDAEMDALRKPHPSNAVQQGQ